MKNLLSEETWRRIVRLRWRRILLYGSAAGILSLLFAAATGVLAVALLGPVLEYTTLSLSMQLTATWIAVWLLPAVTLLLTLLAVARTIRGHTASPSLHSLFVGMVCALIGWLAVACLGGDGASPYMTLLHSSPWRLSRLAFSLPVTPLAVVADPWQHLFFLLVVVLFGCWGGALLSSARLKRGSREVRVRIADLQLPLIVLTSVGITAVAMSLTIVARSISLTAVPFFDDHKQVFTRLQSLHALVIVWLAPASNLFLVGLTSALMARWSQRAGFLNGIMIGVVSALLGAVTVFSLGDSLGYSIVHRVFDLSRPWQILRLPFEIPIDLSPDAPFAARGLLGPSLMLVAGMLGGWSARATLAGRETLSRVSETIRLARTPEDVVTGIGESLEMSGAWQVMLWKIVRLDEGEKPAEVSLLAGWTSSGEPDRSLGYYADAVNELFLPRLEFEEPLLLRRRDVSRVDRALWRQLGAQAILLLPLMTANDGWVGLLMITSQRRQGFGQSLWRTRLIGGQAALAVQNLGLLLQVRQAAVLEERQRLAREIHDTIAQSISSIVMHLEAAEQSLPPASLVAQGHIDQARRTARESLTQARRLVWALRPEPLEQASLPTALKRIAAQWSQSNGRATVAVTGTVRPLSIEVEAALLRAAQEALANVRKHARATQVALTLSYMGDMVVLDVQDDGRGFDPESPLSIPAGRDGGGFGLLAMRERVEQLGGSMIVESVPGQGTTLVVEIMLADRA